MVKLRANFITDTGKVRDENEDTVWAEVFSPSGKPPVGLFIVCDGMGGHMGGKYASYWAVEAIRLQFAGLLSNKDPRATIHLTAEDIRRVRLGNYIPTAPNETDLVKLTEKAIQAANQVVFNYARHKPKTAANAGTTLTMMVSKGDEAVIANIGDSRTYLLREHELIQISKDHSLVAAMVEEGQILPDEIYTHPRRNIIFKYIGQQDQVQVDIYRQQLRRGDWFLLCSDGLWEMIRSDQKKGEIIERAKDPKTACKNLVKAANQAGGEDNISVILVEVC